MLATAAGSPLAFVFLTMSAFSRGKNNTNDPCWGTTTGATDRCFAPLSSSQATNERHAIAPPWWWCEAPCCPAGSAVSVVRRGWLARLPVITRDL